MNKAAMQVLRNLHGRSDGSGYLFPGKNGARKRIRNHLPRIMKAAGLKVTAHTMRHTFASHLVINGESLYAVGKLVGHTVPATTARYSHLNDEALRKTTAAFDKVYTSTIQ